MSDKPTDLQAQAVAMHRQWVLCRARLTQARRALDQSAEQLTEALLRLKGISKDLLTKLAVIAVDSRLHPSKYARRGT